MKWLLDFLMNKEQPLKYSDEYRKIVLINIFLSLLMAFLSLFIVINLIVGFYFLALIETVAFFILLFILLYFHKTTDIKRASYALLTVMTLFIDLFFIKVENNFYSFYFMAIVFPIAYFLLGKKEGTFFSVFYLLYHLGVIALFYDTFEAAIFNHNSLINIAGASFALIFLIYYYESSRMETQKLLNEKNAELLFLAGTDALTQLYNRRYFQEIGQKELHDAKRESKKFCFTMLDIDNFKKYNDTYGHSAGDEVLKVIAKELKSFTNRLGGYAFRVGGEEFVLIFIEQSAQNGFEYVDELRDNIYAMNITHEKNEAFGRVSISAGLVCVSVDEQSSFEKIAQKADELLYRAKEQGRNRVKGTSKNSSKLQLYKEVYNQGKSFSS
jgi:diguanylate cyclase (GGDEF)-like protein